MSGVVTISLLVFVVLLYTRNYYNDKREGLSTDLLRIYGELELSIAAEMNLSNTTIEFLKAYKFLAINPRLLDVVVLQLIHASKKNAVHQKNHDFNKLRSSLSHNSKALLDQFHSVSEELLKMSILRPLSVWWFLKEVVSHCWKAVFTFSAKPFRATHRLYKELSRESYAMAHFAQQGMAMT